jgi:hypothetical protein
MPNIDTLRESVHAQMTRMVREMADAIKFDCRGMIEAGEQLTTPEMVGSPVMPAIPLAPSTIRRKEKIGAISPSTPRLRFGELEESIMSGSLGEDSAFVAIEGDELVAHFQQFGTSRMPAARPFFGVSAEAKAECDAIQARTQERINVEFREMNLQPVNINVNIWIGW